MTYIILHRSCFQAQAGRPAGLCRSCSCAAASVADPQGSARRDAHNASKPHNIRHTVAHGPQLPLPVIRAHSLLNGREPVPPQALRQLSLHPRHQRRPVIRQRSVHLHQRRACHDNAAMKVCSSFSDVESCYGERQASSLQDVCHTQLRLLDTVPPSSKSCSLRLAANQYSPWARSSRPQGTAGRTCPDLGVRVSARADATATDERHLCRHDRLSPRLRQL